eukprot:g7024.t1
MVRKVKSTKRVRAPITPLNIGDHKVSHYNNDVKPKKVKVKKEKVAVKQEKVSTRPKGRAPRGKSWNYATGDWVDNEDVVLSDEEVEEAAATPPPRKKMKRGKGKANKKDSARLDEVLDSLHDIIADSDDAVKALVSTSMIFVRRVVMDVLEEQEVV